MPSSPSRYLRFARTLALLTGAALPTASCSSTTSAPDVADDVSIVPGTDAPPDRFVYDSQSTGIDVAPFVDAGIAVGPDTGVADVPTTPGDAASDPDSGGPLSPPELPRAVRA